MAGAGDFHFSVGGILWSSEWNGDYDVESASYITDYQADRESSLGFDAGVEYRRWFFGLTTFHVETDRKRVYLDYGSRWDGSSIRFGYRFLKNPHVKPFLEYRVTDIRSHVIPEDTYGGTSFWLDHDVSAAGAGIEAGYEIADSGFSLDGRFSISIDGDYDIHIKTVRPLSPPEAHYSYQSNDVDIMDWYAGASYLIRFAHIRLSAGYRQVTEKIDYMRRDVNTPWEPHIDSEIKGFIFGISFEM